MPRKTKPAKGEIKEELKQLGRQLHSTAKAAWESEERRQFESEIVSGLSALASEIEKALDDFAESPQSQTVKARAHEVKQKARSGELGTEGRETLLKALRQMNAELERLQHSWTPSKKAHEEKE
jgi:uncharacterized protein YukE